jgi:hypothetical protein
MLAGTDGGWTKGVTVIKKIKADKSETTESAACCGFCCRGTLMEHNAR